MAQVVLLSGFEPFDGERINPSWEAAERLDGAIIGAARVEAVRLPVDFGRAIRAITKAIERRGPAAVIGLGQAGGRPQLSIEKVAINLADAQRGRHRELGAGGRPVVSGGPDAYFSRLPIGEILRALKRRGIPAGVSLSAGVYVCNAVMYATLHALKRRRALPAGFIHLPYAVAQAARNPNAASMTIDLMAAGVETAVGVVARRL